VKGLVAFLEPFVARRVCPMQRSLQRAKTLCQRLAKPDDNIIKNAIRWKRGKRNVVRQLFADQVLQSFLDAFEVLRSLGIDGKCSLRTSRVVAD